jgi:WhiB family redox-sensing transcriptional regulator
VPDHPLSMISPAQCGQPHRSWLVRSGPALRQVAQAKAICTRCQIQQACLGYALDEGPVQGIWGGTTGAERLLLMRRGRKARAPRARSRQLVQS